MSQAPSAISRLVPAGALLITAAAAFATIALNTIDNGRRGSSEAIQLIKSLWYASGAVQPFAAADGVGAMPAYPFIVGLWQSFVGADPSTARWLSVGLTALSSLLLFTLCRRLTANTLIAAASVFMFLVTPAAAYFHATATPATAGTTLHLAAALLVVQGLGRPRIWISVLFAACLVAFVQLDRTALASLIFLIPLYVLAIGRARALHAAIVLAVVAAGFGVGYLMFGSRWLDVLRWGPLLAPLWQVAGLAPSTFALIET
ncbi:MAG: hypothetical protein FJX59_20465, partial [Alphaproteobacteria bacterium]|nr:hypothetical protein [Alphaproteobacteria bacterium]